MYKKGRKNLTHCRPFVHAMRLVFHSALFMERGNRYDSLMDHSISEASTGWFRSMFDKVVKEGNLFLSSPWGLLLGLFVRKLHCDVVGKPLNNALDSTICHRGKQMSPGPIVHDQYTKLCVIVWVKGLWTPLISTSAETSGLWQFAWNVMAQFHPNRL